MSKTQKATRLEATLLQELKVEAAKSGVTMQALISRILVTWLGAQTRNTEETKR